MGNDVLNSLNTQLIQVMDDHGLTLDRLIDQLSDELQANETKHFAFQGKVEDTREVIAWDVRQRARIDAHKLRGDYPAQGVNLQSSGEHTVVIRKFGDEPTDTE